MRLSSCGHSCIRLEHDGGTIVIDPGAFSEPDAAVGADAVLITHEHPDHLDEERLRGAIASNGALEIWSNPAVAQMIAGLGVPVHTVGHGDAVSVTGFDIHVYGELHAVIHPDIPTVRNVGFLVRPTGGGAGAFHPGDALTVPDVPVEALMLPVHAPWLKLADAIDYARAVSPGEAFGVHDGMLNERGLALVDRLLGGGIDIGTGFRRPRTGDVADLP